MSLSPSHAFATTRWSLVLAAGDADDPAGPAALEELCRRYWFPLYAFLRRRGNDPELARDLTQGFFATLLKRNAFAGLNRGEGRFRSFLLKSLSRYAINEQARATAAKRGGGQRLESIDDPGAEERLVLEPAHDETPERLFERQWALTLLQHALQDLEAEFIAAGKGGQFLALKPYLSRDAEPGEYTAIADRLHIPPGHVAVQVHRLRQRYRKVVRAAVADTVESPLEVDDEMRHLLAVLT